MNTAVIAVDPERPDVAQLAPAATALQRGQLVAFPTETVYGLGGNALDPAAIAGIYVAKGRPASDPLIVHIASADELALVAADVPPLAAQLAAQFWPGALTLVLRRHQRIAPNVAAGSESVAVRVPAHPVARALIAASRVPVAAPSANLFSRPSPTTAGHVLEDLNGRIALVVDAGPTPIGVESTVVSLLEDHPVVLRPGGITIEQLRAHLPTLEVRARYLHSDQPQAPPSPGMLLKHYSPRAEVRLFDGPPEHVARAMVQVVRAEAGARQVGVLATDEDAPLFAGLPVRVFPLGPRTDLQTIAARLFAGMRMLDAAGTALILVASPPRNGLGLAVWDRLLRATEGRIITIHG